MKTRSGFVSNSSSSSFVLIFNQPLDTAKLNKLGYCVQVVDVASKEVAVDVKYGCEEAFTDFCNFLKGQKIITSFKHEGY